MVLLWGGTARATDITGVMPAALDQPRINATIRYPVAGGGATDPLYADFGFNTRAFNIEAFFDTGASGVLLSNNTSSFLGDLYNPGVQLQQYNSKPVIFEDVGVAGSDRFNVSVPIQISLAPYSTPAAQSIADAESTFSASNPASYSGVDLNVYNHAFGPIRAQVGPFLGEDPNQANDNPLLSDLDVFGTPLMKGKVVVMDPKPVENIISGNIDNGFTMNTYVYNPGTPFNSATKDTNPGIPRTTRTVKLSMGSFGPFTQTGTLDASNNLVPIPANEVANYAPTLADNPFIGPNPVNPTGDPTPPVKVSFNGRTANASFLLDTGAAASMISTAVAAQLNVRIRPGTDGTDNPILETFNPANPSATGTPVADQFTLTIGGIGGTKKVPGFFLNSMLLKAAEGDAANDNDARHLRFMDAPVLVTDITVKNPTTNATLTLDGIFGMNNLVASVFITESSLFPDLSDITPGAFDWAVYDEPGKALKLMPRITGDTDRDGAVNFFDLTALSAHYGSDVTGDPTAAGDFNGDGVVNFFDLTALSANYGATDAGNIDLPHYQFDPSASPAVVPEPSTWLGGALIVLLGLRRRR